MVSMAVTAGTTAKLAMAGKAVCKISLSFLLMLREDDDRQDGKDKAARQRLVLGLLLVVDILWLVMRIEFWLDGVVEMP